MWKPAGKILLFLAFLLAVYTINFMDTSISVKYPDGNPLGLPERVNNFGLMNEKQNLLIITGILTFVGIVLVFFTKSTPTDKKEDEVINSQEIASTTFISPSNEKKYENLEKIGKLLEKGLLSKEEFEVEKKKILSDNFVYENKMSNEEPFYDSKISEVVSNIKALIDKEKNKVFWEKSYRREIINCFSESCSTKDDCILIIKRYKSNYNSNLIEELKKLSDNIDREKETLAVFIAFGIVEKVYPFELIK